MKSALTCIIPALCLALLCVFAPHADAASYTWDGNGNDNNGGNWSDPLNWDLGIGYPDDSGDTATLPYPGVARYVTNDVAVTIGQLALAEGSLNTLVLADDLEVVLVDHPSDDGNPRSNIDLNGNTLTVDSGSAVYFPNLDGAGEFVKIGTGQVTLNGELNYTGSFMARNGVLAFRCGDFSVTSMIVTNGGTARSHDVCATLPGTIEIHGDGYTGRGALEFAAGGEFVASDVTVGSDAKIKCISGTTTMTGDILGSGVLTLEGPQTLKITATGITYTNKLIITNGTTQITGTFPDLKHILVDAGGVLEGLQMQFPNATVITQNGGEWIQNLSASWTGSGDGESWSDTTNWSPEIVPTNVATIPLSGVTRTVRVDVATNVYQLAMASDTDNILQLDADMEITLADHPDDAGGSAVIDLNGNTLTVASGGVTYFHKLDGAGTFVKVGTGEVRLNGALSYTGSFMVRNGVLGVRCANLSAASMIVTNGGTAKIVDLCATMPGTIEIHGDGYTSLGALQFAYNGESVESDVTVASDAKIKFTSGTTTMTGDILGSGVLTLEGPETLEIDNMNITYANKFIVTNGTVVINGNLPNITNIWVDAGGVLEGLQSQFPNADVIETNGGVWLTSANATWTGNGDGESWSDTANWSPEVVPTNIATIPLPGSTRTIRVDVATNVYQLAMADGAANVLQLDADMEITLVDHPDDAGGNAVIDLNGNTFTVSSGNALYFPKIAGAGTFVKIGTGEARLQGAINCTASFMASNGVLSFRCGDYSAASATVANGATAKSYDPACAMMPGTFTINGDGYASAGAIEFVSTESFDSDVTVASDATIKRTGTITMSGDLTGPGILTLQGSGTLDLDGAFNFAISGADANSIIASAGTIDINGATLVLTTEGVASESEYVVIDYSGAGSVSGEFATETLPEGWQIEYNGTANSPDCVVAERPPPGVVILVR